MLKFKNLQKIPRGPGPMQMAVNLAQAGAATAVAMAKGLPIHVADEAAASRLAACRKPCDYYVNNGEERCLHRLCGCYLNSTILHKARMTGQVCPIGAWPA